MAVFYGTAGNDTKNGTSGNDTVYGWASGGNASSPSGNDTLNGKAGKDKLYGGTGNDTLDGGLGIDTLNGGTGNDTYIIDGSADSVKEAANSGIDTLLDTRDLLGSKPNPSVGIELDYHTLDSNLENWTLKGQISGNIIIQGNASDNTLIGGDSDNYYIYEVPTSAGSKFTSIKYYYQGLEGGGGNDKLYGEAGNDGLNGNLGNDTLIGGTGNDSLDGSEGNDYLVGSEGNDNLEGDSGGDNLIGGKGNDSLSGSLDTDTLTGNAGADTFEFYSLEEGAPKITDFVVADDTILVYSYVPIAVADTNPSIEPSSYGFGGGLTEDAFITPEQFKLGSAAGDASDRFIYNKNTGALFFDEDGTGTAKQVQFAKLSTGFDLTNADIFVNG